MRDALIERDDEIDLMLTALICSENPLLVGPPGTGKSFLVDSLLQWFGPGTKKMSLLFNKHTQPEEVFGPVSVKGLKEDVYRRITTNKLAEVEIAYGDEFFKASTAILNILLRILNERVFENGDGVFHKVPLKIFIGSSNEYPTGEELGALFDRFLLRKTVKYISTKKGRDKLLWERDHKPSFSTHISTEELEVARIESLAMDFTDAAKECFLEIVDELNREGIRASDRRMYKAIDAVKAYAYLNGADPDGADPSVEKEHLEILAHILWNDPTEQPEKAGKIVAKIANPTGATVNDKLMQAMDIVEKNSPTEAVPKLQEIEKELEALTKDEVNKSKIKSALHYVKSEKSRLYRSIVGDVEV